MKATLLMLAVLLVGLLVFGCSGGSTKLDNCEKVSTTSLRDDCYNSTAQWASNPEYCEQIANYRYKVKCSFEAFSTTRQPLCNVDVLQKKNWCEYLTADMYAEWQKIENEPRTYAEWQDDCYSDYYIWCIGTAKGGDYCAKMKNITKRDNCYLGR